MLLLLALAGMTTYVWGRRLDMSRGGLRHLRKGLLLSSITTLLLAAASTVWLAAPTKGFNFLFVVATVVGNVSNLTSLIYGIHEWNGESVWAALMISMVQLLWVVFGFLVLKSGGA